MAASGNSYTAIALRETLRKNLDDAALKGINKEEDIDLFFTRVIEASLVDTTKHKGL
jgi:hypothetical protein